MAFSEAIAAILDAIDADPAMDAVAVKDYPPNQINRSLVLMAYPLDGDAGYVNHDGDYDGTGDVRIALHKIASDTAAGGLETDIAALMPYFDAIPRIVLTTWAANQFVGTVRHLGRPGSRPLRWERPQYDKWSGLDTVSIRWALTITPA